MDWLNTGCVVYRRSALPDTPFDSVFTGYSLMEDLTLSLRVGRRWRLANARTARVFHDSQPGDHKDDVCTVAAMELVNRHYVMTAVMARHRVCDYCRLLLWEMFQLFVCAARGDTRATLPAVVKGKLTALRQIRVSLNRP